MLTNPGYTELSPLATALLDMVSAARDCPELLPKHIVSETSDVAEQALRLVAVTFTLFHLKVAWPKVKGQKNQSQAREELVKAHKGSDFKGAWSSLPEALKKVVLAFGA